VARVVAGLGDYVTAAIVFTVSVLVGLVARALLKRSIRLWAERSATKMDDVIVGAIDKPIIAWFILGGVYASLPYLDLSPPLLTTAERGLLISLILSVSWALANIAGGVVRFYGSRIGAGLQVSSLGQVLAKVAILTLGIVIILAELGIEVTPLIASLGIGALAIALALQDTLANIFSGLYVLAEKSVRVGDFVRIEGVGEGRIVDIGWRSTRILTLPNNLVVIPNKKLAESIVTNYDLPDPSTNLETVISVGFSEDPERVEAILRDEVRRAIQELPGAEKGFEPIIRFSMGEYSLNFTVVWKAVNVMERGVLQHEMAKRVFRRLRAEGVEIPFPVRTLYIRSTAGMPARSRRRRSPPGSSL
jgi:small-conductance mechanosensitive channel